MVGGRGTDEGFHDQFGFEGSYARDSDTGLDAFLSVRSCREVGERVEWAIHTFAVP